MNKTVDELLQMVHDRIGEEKETFARTGALRRLAQFRQVIGQMRQLKVNIPKPAMSGEGAELLKNSPKVSTRRSSRKKASRAEETKEVVSSTTYDR